MISSSLTQIWAECQELGALPGQRGDISGVFCLILGYLGNGQGFATKDAPERPVPAARCPSRPDGRDGMILTRRPAIRTIAVVLLLVSACGAPTPTEAPRATQLPPTLAPISPTSTPVPPAPTPVPPTATPAPPAATPTVAPTKTKTASSGTQVELEPEPTVALTTVEEFHLQSDQFTVVGDLQVPNTAGQHPAIIMVHGDGRINRTDQGKYLPLMKRFLRAGYAFSAGTSRVPVHLPASLRATRTSWASVPPSWPMQLSSSRCIPPSIPNGSGSGGSARQGT